jgi:hypothetical protein
MQQRLQEAVDSLDMRVCNTSLLTIEMLAKVYFPSTAKELEDLQAQSQTLGSILVRVVNSTDQLSMKNTSQELVTFAAHINESSVRFKKQVIQALQRLHTDVVELNDGQPGHL